MSGERLAGRLTAWAGATGAVLLVPLIALGLTEEVAWTAGDFAFAGGLLLGAGLVYELAVRRLTLARRLAVGAALFGAAALVWLNAAVGLVGG